MKKIILSVAIILASAASIWADNVNTLSRVDRTGKEYYCYKAETGDTMYGVSKKFGWNLDILIASNPGTDALLKNSQKIYYPVDDKAASVTSTVSADKTTSAAPAKYKVKGGDTVYGLAKKFGVSIDDFYKANPDARYGLQEGETISLPAPGEYKASEKEHPAAKIAETPDGNVYIVKKGDNIFNIAREHGVSSQDIIAANPRLDKGVLQIGERIVIPEKKATEETPISTPAPSAPVVTETPVETPVAAPVIARSIDDPVKLSVLLAKENTKRDIDFVRGIMTALYEKRAGDWKVDLKVFYGDAANIAQTLADSAFCASEMILTTYEERLPETLVAFSGKNNIPVVNVFNLKSDDYLKCPGIIQLLPPSDDFNEMIINAVEDKFGDKMFVFYGKDAEDAIGNKLYENVGGANRITVDTPAQLEALINNDSDVVVYAFPSKKIEIQKILDAVIAVKDRFPLANISLVGRPQWVIYDDSFGQKYQAADTYIPSRFYFNPKGLDEKDFTDRYVALNTYQPVRSFPMYSVMGYDLANSFVPAIAESKSLDDSSAFYYTPLQLDFNFVRKPGGGFLNNTAYLLRFTPFGTIDKILVK